MKVNALHHRANDLNQLTLCIRLFDGIDKVIIDLRLITSSKTDYDNSIYQKA